MHHSTSEVPTSDKKSWSYVSRQVSQLLAVIQTIIPRYTLGDASSGVVYFHNCNMLQDSILQRLQHRKALRSWLLVWYECIMRILFSLPRFSACNYCKSLFLRANGAVIGKRVIYYPGVWIAPGRSLVLGDDIDLAVNVHIESAGGVQIGDRTLVGFGTKYFPPPTAYLLTVVGSSLQATPKNLSPSARMFGWGRM